MAKTTKAKQPISTPNSNPVPTPDGSDDTTKITHSKLHDFSASDKGKPVKVKKETKHTTTIKPVVPSTSKISSKVPVRKDSGPVASTDQRKQMAALCSK
jgi:hypothetical protein